MGESMIKNNLKTNLTDIDYKENNVFISAESADTINNSDLPPERYELLKAIEYLATLEGDWNGYSATPPTILSLIKAKKFIEKLFLNRLYPDKVSPDGDGGIIFKWSLTNKERILLTIDGSLTHLSHEEAGKPDIFISDVSFDNDIPKEILAHIPLKKRASGK